MVRYEFAIATGAGCRGEPKVWHAIPSTSLLLRVTFESQARSALASMAQVQLTMTQEGKP